MTMIDTVSDRGLAFTGLREGDVLLAYRDSGGVLTIGKGHTSMAGAPKVTPGMVITQERSDGIFRRDAVKYSKRAAARMQAGGHPCQQHEHDGGFDFDYNTGRVHNATWVKLWRGGDMPGAKASLRLWNKVGGRVVRGLVNRRNAEVGLIFDGDYGDARPRSVSRGETEVREYQKQLATLGYYAGKIDGIAGDRTRDAVEAFQVKQKMLDDGVVGSATRAALNRAVEKKQATKATAGGGAATGVGAGGLEQTSGVDPATVVETASAALVWGLGAVALIVILFLIWRYRGVILKRRTPA